MTHSRRIAEYSYRHMMIIMQSKFEYVYWGDISEQKNGENIHFGENVMKNFPFPFCNADSNIDGRGFLN